MTMPAKAAGAEPVDGMRERNEAEFGEEEIERAEAGEDVLDAERADEGRQDDRDEERGAEEVAAGKAAAGEEDGERNGDERGEDGGGDGDFDAVDEGLAIEPVFDEEAEEAEGESFVPVGVGEDERALEQAEHGINEEAAEEKGEEGEEKVFHRGAHVLFAVK